MKKLLLTRVLAVSKDDALTIGAPFVNNATVTASVIGEGKGKKLLFISTKLKRLPQKTWS